MTIPEAWTALSANDSAMREQYALIAAGNINGATFMTLMARQDELRAAIAARAVLS